MLKVVLYCSLLANAALAFMVAHEPASRYDAWQRIEHGYGASAAGASSSRDRSRERRPAGNVPGDYYASLESLGLDEWEAKTLVLARLEREALAALAPPADEYWRSEGDGRLDHALAVLEAEETVRSRLSALFGDGAADDPVFAKLFRPLDPYFSFLTSTEQLAVRRARLEARRGRTQDRSAPPAAAASASFAVGLQSSASGRPGSAAAPAPVGGPDLAAVLPAPALFEYELRESPVADRLRSARADLAEQEFREAFTLLRALAGGGPLREHLRMRSELERLLGPRAFVRLWASRDPLFRSVAAAAGQRGWSEQTTMDAYELLARLDEQLLRTVDAAGGDAAVVAERLRELEAGVSSQLAGLVGEDGAYALLSLRAAQSIPAEAGVVPGSGSGPR